jgi:hypothetical protein
MISFARHCGACLALLVLGLTARSDPPAPPLDKATDAQVRKLQEERREALREVIRLRLLRARAGSGHPTALLAPARRLLEAELELAAGPADRVAAHQRHWRLMKQVEEMAFALRKAGGASVDDYQELRAARLEAEVALIRVAGKLPKDK